MPAFHAPIDLTRNELRNAAYQSLGQAPATPVVGQFYWDTALGKPRIWDGAGWLDMVGNAGLVTAVNATAPIVSTGGTAPTLSITSATTSAAGSMSATDKAKLDGVAAGATANSTDAQLRDRATHTGTQPLSTITGHDKAAHDSLGIDAGTVEGATAAQLRARSTHTGTQSIGTITGLQAALDATEKTANRNAPNGYAGLDANGKLPGNALPAIAITDTFVVASQAAMVALTAQVGDVAIRTDSDQSFILRAEPASTLANWELLRSPTDGVTAVSATAPITSTGGTAPTIGLADGGVTNAKLGTNAVTAGKVHPDVAGAGLTGGGGDAISVNPGAGLEVVSDAVRLATSAAGNGLTGGGGSALAVGAGTGITVAATTVAINTSVVARKFSADLAAAASQVLTHNLNTRDVQVTVREVASPYAQVFADVEMTSVNTVTVRFATAPAAGAYRCTVVG